MTVTFFNVAVTPADNGSSATNPTVVTPPASMQAGDLVVMFGDRRASSGSISMSETGGQSWNSLTENDQNTQRTRIFWCNFNGTWSANPSINMGATLCNSAVMLVFRSSNTDAFDRGFAADNALSAGAFAAPGSPYTVTITGLTRQTAVPGVAIAFWAVAIANTWGTLSGTGWSQTNLTAQYRNTAGSDQSIACAYNIGTGATNNVSLNESAGTAGAKSILSFKEKVHTVSNKPAYLKGGVVATSSEGAYLRGGGATSSSHASFLKGGVAATSSKPAYLSGSPATVKSSKSAFLIGILNLLIPNGLSGSSGSWLNQAGSSTNIHLSIDETIANDTDYIYDKDPTLGDYYECLIAAPSGIPGTGDVTVFWRGNDLSNLGVIQATVQLRQNTTVIASQTQTLSSSIRTYYFTLSAAERANITDWASLRLRIIPANI